MSVFQRYKTFAEGPKQYFLDGFVTASLLMDWAGWKISGVNVLPWPAQVDMILILVLFSLTWYNQIRKAVPKWNGA